MDGIRRPSRWDFFVTIPHSSYTLITESRKEIRRMLEGPRRELRRNTYAFCWPSRNSGRNRCISGHRKIEAGTSGGLSAEWRNRTEHVILSDVEIAHENRCIRTHVRAFTGTATSGNHRCHGFPLCRVEEQRRVPCCREAYAIDKRHDLPRPCVSGGSARIPKETILAVSRFAKHLEGRQKNRAAGEADAPASCDRFLRIDAHLDGQNDRIRFRTRRRRVTRRRRK